MKAIKSLLILVVLLGLGYLAGVWYSGNQAQKYYQNQYASLSEFLQKNFPEIKVTEQSYDKSFFGAKSVFAVEMDAKPSELLFRSWCFTADKQVSALWPDVEEIQEVHKACEAGIQGESIDELITRVFPDKGGLDGQPQIQLKYVLSSEIQHGPWIKGHGFAMFYAQSKIGLENEFIPQGVKDYIASVQIESVRSFSKDMDTYLSAPAVPELVLAGVRIGFSGFTLHTRLYSNDQRSDMDLTIPELSYEALDARYQHRFNIKDISIKTSGRHSESVFLWLSSGVSTLSIGEVLVSTPHGDKDGWFKCEKINVETKANYKDELYSENMDFSGKCTTNFVEPLLTLDMKGVYKLENINFKPVIAFMKGYMGFLPKIWDYRSSVSESEIFKELLRLTNENLPDFVAPGPLQETEYVISVNDIPQAFRFVSSVGFRPLTEDEKGMAWYLMLPSKLSFKTAYYIDESLFEKGMPIYDMPPLKDLLAGLGSVFSSEDVEPFVKEGSMYKIEFGYDAGNLLLNGKRTSIFDKILNSRRY